MENTLQLDDNAKIFLYCGIGLYILVIVFIGYIAGKRVKGMGDFLVAGRRLPLWMATATLLATWFGAGSSMGVASTVYSDGIGGVIADPFAAALSLILAGIFIVGKLRHLRLLTVTEIIERKYGKWAGVYASCWLIPVYIGWLGAQVLGIGTILKMLFDLPISYGTLIGAGLVLGYTIAGGMWAVTLTDVVQVSLIILGLLMIVPGAIEQAGGFDTIFAGVPEAHLSLLPHCSSFQDWIYYIGQWCIMGLGCMVGQDLIQRSLSSRTEKIATVSAILAGVGYLGIAVVPLTIGFAARLVLPELQDTDMLLPLMAGRVLHPIVFTIFLSALLSAIMSSADSSLLAASSLITNNIIRPFRPLLNERDLLQLTRVFTLMVTIVALLAALQVQSIYSLMINCWASQLVIVFLPVVAALYLKKAGPRNCWSGMLAATAVGFGALFYLLTFTADGIVPPLRWAMSDRVMTIASMYGFLAGVFGFLASYLVDRWSKHISSPELEANE